MLTYIEIERVPIECLFLRLHLPSSLLLFLKREFRNGKFNKCVLLRIGGYNVKETALEYYAVILEICLDSVVRIFKLNKRKSFPLSVTFFHGNMRLSNISPSTLWQ